jgi:hypothetical protein
MVGRGLCSESGRRLCKAAQLRLFLSKATLRSSARIERPCGRGRFHDGELAAAIAGASAFSRPRRRGRSAESDPSVPCPPVYGRRDGVTTMRPTERRDSQGAGWGPESDRRDHGSDSKEQGQTLRGADGDVPEARALMRSVFDILRHSRASRSLYSSHRSRGRTSPFWCRRWAQL